MSPTKVKVEPFDLRDARLNGRPILAHMGRATVSIDMSQTTDGASSVKVTVRDPEFDLLRSGLFAKGVELVAWSKTWTYVGMEENDDRSIVAAFESKRVNQYKRDQRKLSMKATRPKFTQVALAGTPVLFPDQSRVRSATVGAVGVGLGSSEKVTIRGKAATREQRVVLDTMLAAAYEQGASVAELRALVAAAIAETSALNVVANDGTRGGVLRLSQSVAPTVAARDMRAVARWFVAGSTQGSPQLIAATRLQRAASRYAPFVPQAATIVSSFLRGDAVRIAKASALVKRQLTERVLLTVGAPQGEAGESRWEAVNRIWSAFGWYVYETDAGFTIVTGQQVSVAKPDLVIGPEDPGVLMPSFSQDEGFIVSSLNCTLREEHVGAVSAGMVVDVVNYGNGNGRYLITSLTRSTSSMSVQVTLETPRPVRSGENAGTKDSVGANGLPDAVAKAYAKAQEIGKRHYPYAWGGGHGSFNGPYDCSGFVSALLHAGGALSTPQTTYGLANVGKPGKGKYMTFWVHNTSDPSRSHTYASFNVNGKQEKWEAGGGGGATGLRPGGTIERSGFQPRHIDGW